MSSSKIQKRVGKAQARDELSTLIDAVNSGAGAIEITDYGKVAAVLVSEKEFAWLSACAKRNLSPKREARELMSLSDDDALEDATREIFADFDTSLSKSASQL